MKGYSNFDHTSDEGLEKYLRDGGQGSHYAWDYYGVLTFHNDTFYNTIKCYGIVVDEISGDTLEEVITKAIARWGSK